MNTLKLKTTEQSWGTLTLQNPLAEVGHHGAAITYSIENIPDGVSQIEVLKLANLTAMVKGFVFDYTQLGIGKIVTGRPA